MRFSQNDSGKFSAKFNQTKEKSMAHLHGEKEQWQFKTISNNEIENQRRMGKKATFLPTPAPRLGRVD